MSALREVAQQALEAPGCARLREWASIGPVQRAAVESFLQAALAQQEQEQERKMNYTPTGRTQTIVERKVLGDGWTELDVRTVAHGQMESRTTIKTTKDTAPFIDIAIE